MDMHVLGKCPAGEEIKCDRMLESQRKMNAVKSCCIPFMGCNGRQEEVITESHEILGRVSLIIGIQHRYRPEFLILVLFRFC